METKQDVSGASSASVEDQTDTDKSSGAQKASKGKDVKWEDHQRVLEDLHKFKNGMRESEKKYNELAKKIEDGEKEQLKQKENYKTLWEREVETGKKYKEQFEGLKANVIRDKKYMAVFPALKKEGLRDDAEKLLDNADFESLVAEYTNTGKFTINGVEQFVETFKGEYPFAFKENKVPTVNSGGGGNQKFSSEEITPRLLVELEKKDPAKYRELLPKYLERRKAQIK